MKKILILEGGHNEEHKVSLKTSKEVGRSLKKLRIHYKTLIVNPATFSSDISKFSNDYICFNALHGPFGEDGQIQKILKSKKFKVTHSNQVSSINCFDKVKSKKIVKNLKIHTPKYDQLTVFEINENYLKKIREKYKKFIIKPVNSGSSHGLIIIKSKKDLYMFLKKLYKFKRKFDDNEKILIEEYISGKELTVSVMDNESETIPLQVTEIVSLNKSYDYQAKYSKGFSKHYIPARITKINHLKCLVIATKIHKEFKCNTLSRIDLILDAKKNKIFFLEINSQPGLTKLSLLPEQAKYRKLSFENIVINLIENAK